MAESSAGYESVRETAIKLKELGNLAFKEKQYDEAVTYYEVAILLHPAEISFYNNIAGNLSLVVLEVQCYVCLQSHMVHI